MDPLIAYTCMYSYIVGLEASFSFLQTVQSLYNVMFELYTVLQISLTTISTCTGPNETWSVPAIFNAYMY